MRSPYSLAAIALAVWCAAGGSWARTRPATHTDRPALSVVWRREFDIGGLEPSIAADGLNIYVAGGTRVLAISADVGTKTWDYRGTITSVLSAPVVIGDGTVVTASGFAVIALDRRGHERWTFAFGKTVLGSEFLAGQSPIVTPGGVILAAGGDALLHALDRSGKLLWSAPLALYGVGRPGIMLAATNDLLLVDGRPHVSGAPVLIGIDLGTLAGKVRFTADLGLDIASIAAGGPLGIVATSYSETTSRLGATTITSLDGAGRRRWSVARGRQERALAISANGDLITTSRDAAGLETGSRFEIWRPDGSPVASKEMKSSVSMALATKDGTIYVLSCDSHGARLDAMSSGLTHSGSLIWPGTCPQAAVMDRQGRLFVARVANRQKIEQRYTEVIAIETPGAPSDSWAMRRANPEGSAAFSLPR
jgi:outer membrane protein assembly factor BamB